MKSYHTKTRNRERTSSTTRACALGSALIATMTSLCPFASAEGLPTGAAWNKVVNNQNSIPGSGGVLFNSYNQPSVNTTGFVVFRARGKGGDFGSGIFIQDMLVPDSPLEAVATRATTVPAPNNTIYSPGDGLATFNEFPSIPRISMWSKSVATRGNSQPVWSYLVDGTDTRAGTTGIFLHRGTDLVSAVNLLGAVPAPEVPVPGDNYFPYMAVPGAAPGTRFDVFPGSPAIADHDIVAFKGNYTEDGTGKTGVFFRDPVGSSGLAPVQLVANSSTVIPNLPVDVSGVTFGSTAPPSAAGDKMVFAGFDNEDSPTYGGIYLAPLVANPTLTTLVGIGDPVPGETEETFNRFSEALSFDGRYLAFWGAWGTETIRLWMDCPTDGNKDVLEYCREHYGDNYPVDVPANQGIFVVDTRTGAKFRVARTGEMFSDFVFWNFSGKPPAAGGSEEGDDGEPPRWRNSAFVAVSAGPRDTFMVAFKARSGEVDPVEHNYLNPIDGIYLGDATEVITVLDTTTDGQALDPAAPAGSKITALGIERDGFRGRYLALTASMVEPVSTEAMAGIYLTRMLTPRGTGEFVPGVYSTDLLPFAEDLAKPAKSTRISLTKNGRFWGRVVIDGTVRYVRGKLNADGQAQLNVKINKRTRQVKLEACNVSGIEALDITVIGEELNHTGLAVQDSDAEPAE